MFVVANVLKYADLTSKTYEGYNNQHDPLKITCACNGLPKKMTNIMDVVFALDVTLRILKKCNIIINYKF